MLRRTRRAAKNVFRKLSSSSKHSGSTSSRDQMSVDSVHQTSESREEVELEVPRTRIRIRVMTMIEHNVVRTACEREILERLQNRSFAHHKSFENMLLIKTGLGQDMDRAFRNAGWDEFINFTESGSQFLTMEFFMSLNIIHLLGETQIRFRFFNEEFLLTPKEMSIALGFHKRCLFDPNALLRDHCYRNSWWDSISDDPVGNKNSITSIHNPTLRF